MQRRHFLKMLGPSLVASHGVANGQIFQILGRKRETSPNIILMMADDMGMGDVNYYGWNEKDVQTPHLDEMSATGLRFDRFYAQAPVCSPTRGSCLTGRHPFRFGVFEANNGGLRMEETTLPEILKAEAGYTCGHFGKWHLGRFTEDKINGKASRMEYSTPGMNGFDEWFSAVHAVKTWNPYGPDGLEDPRSVDEDYNPYFHNGVEYTDPLMGDTSKIIMDRAIPFMENALAEGKPFLSAIWFHTPHKEYDAHPDDKALYPGEDENVQCYYGSITAMDRQIGRLRQWLRDRGIEKNTLLWFTCDNGPTGKGSAGPYLGEKRMLFEGGIRVPTILEWPEKIPVARTTDMLAGTSDYFLTHLDAAGIEYTDTYPQDGISLMPLIKGTISERPGYLAFQSHSMEVIMNQDYKAIRTNAGATYEQKTIDNGFPIDEWYLIDMQSDEFETENVASQHPELVQTMAEEYTAWNDSCRDSFYGADYDDPNYDPGRTYRKDGGA